jgi:hypothetical protein
MPHDLRFPEVPVPSGHEFLVRNDYGYVSSVTPFPGDGQHFARGLSYLSPYLPLIFHLSPYLPLIFCPLIFCPLIFSLGQNGSLFVVI